MGTPIGQKFGIKVEESWGFSIGIGFSVTPKDVNDNREWYLFINAGKKAIYIGKFSVYSDPEDEL